jgi:hypothetical protein
MDAADCLYGVSMANDGVSKVVSRRMPREEDGDESLPEQPGRRFSRERSGVEEAA